MTPRCLRAMAVTCIVMLLAGCGFSSPMRTYVLGDPVSSSTGVWSEANLPVVELKSVSVPDYLDSSDILRRVGSNEVAASPTGRWGERLSLGITDALATALAKRLPKVALATSPGSEPAARIFVDVERFDIAADGQCLVAARWRITAGHGQTTPEGEHGTFRETAASIDDGAIAQAMTRAVDQLAEQIALTTNLALARRVQ